MVAERIALTRACSHIRSAAFPPMTLDGTLRSVHPESCPTAFDAALLLHKEWGGGAWRSRMHRAVPTPDCRVWATLSLYRPLEMFPGAWISTVVPPLFSRRMPLTFTGSACRSNACHGRGAINVSEALHTMGYIPHPIAKAMTGTVVQPDGQSHSLGIKRNGL